jgi:hypothetical protein
MFRAEDRSEKLIAQGFRRRSIADQDLDLSVDRGSFVRLRNSIVCQ